MKLRNVPGDRMTSLEYLANLQADHFVPSQTDPVLMDLRSLHL